MLNAAALPASAPPALQGRADTPANRAAAAVKFEGLMMAEMLSAMRSAKLDDGLFERSGEDQWRRMGDQLLAETLAARSPLGLAKMLEVTP